MTTATAIRAQISDIARCNAGPGCTYPSQQDRSTAIDRAAAALIRGEWARDEAYWAAIDYARAQSAYPREPADRDEYMDSLRAYV